MRPLEQVARVPDTFRHHLDLLIVVDDTEHMAAIQQSTTDLWYRLRGRLPFAEGGFPDVRIGVISSDLGVGADGLVSGCSAAGDGGALQPTGDGARWLEVDADDPATSDPGVAAQVTLGERGCAFEQPLAAMRRALDASQPANAGFLREHAALGVVFVAGDDDCSIDDLGFFSSGDKLSKFRCFRDGVRCGGDDVYVGAQHGCVPQDASAYLADVAPHARFLIDLKKDPSALVVGGVIGDPDRVEIVEAMDGLSLSPACADPRTGSQVYPGVRLGAFIGPVWKAWTDRVGSLGGLCEDSPGDIGAAIGGDLRRALGHRCLEGAIASVRTNQQECAVHIVDRDGHRRDLDACDNPNHVYEFAGPCYAIKPGPGQCGDFPSQLAVQVNWGGADKVTTPPGVTTYVECVVEPDSGPVD